MDISTNRIGCVVLEGGTDEIIEKKSRFIAQVFPVQTEQEAMQIIEQTKKKYWDARHNCYAFILGEHGEVSRCTDDGEPSGTAGRPILECYIGAGVHDILCDRDTLFWAVRCSVPVDWCVPIPQAARPGLRQRYDHR